MACVKWMHRDRIIWFWFNITFFFYLKMSKKTGLSIWLVFNVQWAHQFLDRVWYWTILRQGEYSTICSFYSVLIKILQIIISFSITFVIEQYLFNFPMAGKKLYDYNAMCFFREKKTKRINWIQPLTWNALKTGAQDNAFDVRGDQIRRIFAFSARPNHHF